MRRPECELRSWRQEDFNVLSGCLVVKMKRCCGNISIRKGGGLVVHLFV